MTQGVCPCHTEAQSAGNLHEQATRFFLFAPTTAELIGMGNGGVVSLLEGAYIGGQSKR